MPLLEEGRTTPPIHPIVYYLPPSKAWPVYDSLVQIRKRCLFLWVDTALLQGAKLGKENMSWIAVPLTPISRPPAQLYWVTLVEFITQPWAWWLLPLTLTQTLRHQAAFLLCFLPLPTALITALMKWIAYVSKVPTPPWNPNTEPRRTAEDSGSITGLCLGLATWAGLLTGLQPLADESARRVYVSRSSLNLPFRVSCHLWVCISIWSKFKQKFRTVCFLVLINNS